MRIPHLRLLLAAAAVLLLAAAAPAQVDYTLAVDRPASNFTWSGNTTLGPIVGNPSNQFQADGTVGMRLNPGKAPFVTGTFNGGVMTTVPDLHGQIPNPVPGFPPLATIDIIGIQLTTSSATFPVGGGGGFSTDLDLTFLAGNAIITPLVGSPSNVPLAGYTSNFPAAGSVTELGGAIRLHIPVNATYSFSDPGSGVSGDVTIVGDVYADATVQNTMDLVVGPLTAGQPGSFTATAGQPGALTFLAYSLQGPGETPVGKLGVTLALAKPQQAGPAIKADGTGKVVWTLPVPSKAAGVTAWFQCAQPGRTSNIASATVN